MKLSEHDWRYPSMIKIRKILSDLTGLTKDEVEQTFQEPPEHMRK